MDKLKLRFMIVVLRLLYLLAEDKKAFSRLRPSCNKLLDELEYEYAESQRLDGDKVEVHDINGKKIAEIDRE